MNPMPAHPNDIRPLCPHCGGSGTVQGCADDYAVGCFPCFECEWSEKYRRWNQKELDLFYKWVRLDNAPSFADYRKEHA